MGAMKAAMKVKKASMKKAMKKEAMKKAMKKVSVIAKGKFARAAVFRGSKAKTASGMTKATLKKSKSGKIVSKASSDRAKKAYASSGIKKWADACKAARKALNLKGFVPMGGKTAAGKALYAKAKSLMK